nr:folate-binding protein [Pseudoxanthomonas sp.]
MHKILIPTPLADNLPPPETPAATLSDHAVLSLEGPDAVAFAHAQFSSEVTSLAVGQWQWSAWLTPKGRVIALFALARRGEQELVMVVPDYPVDTLAATLQRYVFRRKLKIAVRPDLPVRGVMAPPAQASGALLGESADGLELDRSDAGGARHWRIGGQATAGITPVADWRRHDLRHGLPRLPEDQREQWTPQQLSLDRLHAYSVKKGCYPGQEIVARTHFLGKAKRALVLFESDAPPHPGSTVGDGVRDIGEVICVQDGVPAVSLAVMPLERESATLAADGIALKETPLLD